MRTDTRNCDRLSTKISHAFHNPLLAFTRNCSTGNLTIVHETYPSCKLRPHKSEFHQRASKRILKATAPYTTLHPCRKLVFADLTR